MTDAQNVPQRVIAIIAEQAVLDPADVRPEMTLADLGIDSLGLVEAMAVQFIPGTFGGSPWKDVWAFGLLILVLVFRPQGILGAKVVDRA